VSVPMEIVRADFDRLAALSDDGWEHNSHYHGYLLAQFRITWAAHSPHDSYLTLSELRRLCATTLPGATVCPHLFWRYSIVWRKA
jgi:hypothetical protein